MVKKAGVFLGYLHGNDVAASFHRSFMDLVMTDQMNPDIFGNLVSWGGVRAAATDLWEARNIVAAAALESDSEYLVFIDGDMGFDQYAVAQLVDVAQRFDLPIVGGLCFMWKELGYDGRYGLRTRAVPTIFDKGTDNDGVVGFRPRPHYPVNTLLRCDSTGTAMVLIHRRVLEEIQEKYGPVWFDRIPNPTAPNNKPYGEDTSFFIRSGSLGIPCHVHTGIRTNHQKTVWVGEEQFWDDSHTTPADTPVDVIVPTVKPRAGNIPDLANTLKATSGYARLLLVVDDEEHAGELEQYGETIVFPGSFAKKINAAYPHTTAPWIQVVGDDCRFHPSWLDHQQLVARLYGAKVIGSNDMANPRVMKGEHATHWMIARDYIDEVGASWDGPGIVAHEGYRHWFVDDEIVNAARQRGVFQMALGARIEHMHPIAGKAEVDEVYEKNDRYAKRDRELFERRVRKHAAS